MLALYPNKTLTLRDYRNIDCATYSLHFSGDTPMQ